MGHRIVLAVAGLMAGTLVAGCAMLSPPGPLAEADNIGTDASGSHIVTATKDPDAIERHLAEPAEVDEFTMVPKPGAKTSVEKAPPKSKAETRKKYTSRKHRRRRRRD